MKQIELPFFDKNDICCANCKFGPRNCEFDEDACWWDRLGLMLRGKYQRYYNFWESM